MFYVCLNRFHCNGIWIQLKRDNVRIMWSSIVIIIVFIFWKNECIHHTYKRIHITYDHSIKSVKSKKVEQQNNIYCYIVYFYLWIVVLLVFYLSHSFVEIRNGTDDIYSICILLFVATVNSMKTNKRKMKKKYVFFFVCDS